MQIPFQLNDSITLINRSVVHIYNENNINYFRMWHMLIEAYYYLASIIHE